MFSGEPFAEVTAAMKGPEEVGLGGEDRECRCRRGLAPALPAQHVWPCGFSLHF